MVGKYVINNKSLNQISENLSWEGSGKRLDPIIINSKKNLNERIKMRKVDSFVSIKDITVGEIFLTKCTNITLDNCKIYYLKLIACHNIIVRNCSIVHGNLKYCRDNSFENNILHSDYSAYTISQEGVKIGDNAMNFLQKIYFIPFIILMSISIFALIFKNFIIGIGSLLSSIIPLLPFIDIRMKKKIISNLEPNKFDNNSYNLLEDLCQKYKNYVF